MATRTRPLIQDENLISHFKATSIGTETKFSKGKKATTGLGGRKPLSTITNSGKPSPSKASKNFIKKLGNQEFINSQITNVLIQNDNFKGDSFGGKPKTLDAKKGGLGGGRKALSNITNSRVSIHQESKKSYPKTSKDIAEEQFLHNHQECINSQNGVMDMQYFMKTLGFDDGCSMRLSSPYPLPSSLQLEADCFSPPRQLEHEEVPEFLSDYGSPPKCGTPEHLLMSPSPNRYINSPTLMILESP